MEKQDSFIIEGLGGKKTLSGRIVVGGAKNAIIKVLAASILFKDDVVVANVPEIEDVERMKEVLQKLGAQIEPLKDHSYSIKTSKVTQSDISPDISKRMRSSIVMTGPLLGRFGQVSFPHPGGCVIGKRPIDLFLTGFEKMGATVKLEGDTYIIQTKDGKLSGAEIFFKNQSVTATETFMMAAILAKGKTILKNVATEPEIVSLGEFLIECGAKIEGLGTSTIEIIGNGMLSGKGRVYETLPDRIEAGSFLILGALAAKELEIANCRPEHLDSLISLMRDSGVEIETKKTSIVVRGGKNYLATDIKTHEYPGFPTDLQAPLSIFLTQAKGESFIFETIFEGRLNYLEALNFMGANTRLIDAHRAIIYGPTVLKGREMVSPDLRAGLAYILAAIIAKGRSVVHNAYYVDRGYENIEGRLRELGVNIERQTN